MTFSTPFTRMFGLRHPIALAPMGGTAGGALAAAVSRGGGLGMLGAGGGDPVWLEREVPLAAATGLPWGMGFLTWTLAADTVPRALQYEPHAVMLSFGDPLPHARYVRDAGVRLIVQVTDLDEARRAVDAGADLIVAQGTEGGGHGARRGRSTLPFVPAVADLVAPTPVLAAGGIADGRGVAAALALGASGALIGTRYQATAESLVPDATAKAIVAASSEETERNRVLDIARGSAWPSRYTARTLAHRFLDEWRDREDELTASPAAHREYAEGVASGELPAMPEWAGESVDLIHDLPGAEELTERLGAEASGVVEGLRG